MKGISKEQLFLILSVTKYLLHLDLLFVPSTNNAHIIAGRFF